MITITVDCDNDEVRIDSGDNQPIKMKVKYPSQHLKVLEEVLNLLDASGVSLDIQDEGEVRNIAEW